MVLRVETGRYGRVVRDGVNFPVTHLNSFTVGLRLLSLVWAVLIAPLAIVLLVVATTLEGRGFAIAAILGGMAPFVAVSAWESSKRKRGVLAIAMMIGCSVLAAWIMSQAPRGTAAVGAKVQHLSLGKGARFRPFALGNLLPEIDQLMLGFVVMPFVDPLLTTAQSVQLRKLAAAIYREMEKDPDFHALGSVMPLAYDDLLGGGEETGHAYIYIPPDLDRSKPAPTLVFLHGSGGNFKAYLWLISRIANELGMVVIAPSFGMGNWRQPASVGCYNAAIAAAADIVRIDPENIHIMGLSNGGLAVSQLARTKELRFRSLVFLSPVFELDRFHSLSFREGCRGRSFLVITGQDDDRVPFEYVAQAAKEMRSAGAQVTFEPVDGADHFLFFSKQELVARKLVTWLKANGVPK